LLVSNAALRSAIKQIYHLKGPGGAEWLQDFERQLLYETPPGIIDRADQERGELNAVVTFMVQALFEVVRLELAEEVHEASSAAASTSTRLSH
jgi:hypothetical protein